MEQPDWSEASAKAAALRQAFEMVIEEVRSGDLDLDGAHTRADSDALTGAVFAVKVYEAVPGIGKVKARRTMEALGLDEDATLGAVPAAARAAILERFAELKHKPLQPRNKPAS